MDIDDILAEVSASAGGIGSAGGVLGAPETQDLQALTRAWVNERCAPELLPWPAPLMARLLDRLRRQIELVEEQTGDLDPRVNFRLIVVQTELERFKFLVRSFVRTRLAKLDQHAPYYLSQATKTPDLLSPHEQQYASQHQALLADYVGASFLSAFPAQLQRLDDTAGGISMVDGPDADAAVFVRALTSAADADNPVVVPGTDIAFSMAPGDVYVTRWSAVKELVESQAAELV